MKKHFLIFTISLLFFSLAQGKVKLSRKDALKELGLVEPKEDQKEQRDKKNNE